MPKPLIFEREITTKRIVEEIEAIEEEIDGASRISEAGRTRLRELRIAVETKPLDTGH